MEKKILWLTNVPFPEFSALVNKAPSPYGGWLLNSSRFLSNQPGVTLSVAFPYSQAKEYNLIKGDSIDFIPFHPISNNNIFIKILKDLNPDLVHIHGSEMVQSLFMVQACNKLGIKSVISIQGLVSVYKDHMYANLPFSVVYGHTVRSIVFRDNVYGIKNKFTRQGHAEVEALKNIEHIIGRTTWDKACSSQINPKACYHFCNESLRPDFYKKSWSYDHSEPYSIFVSQGSSPIKGLHELLKALPIVLKSHPDTRVYVAGRNPIKDKTLKGRLSWSYYGKYLNRLISENDLKDSIVFCGELNELEMVNKMSSCRLFVLPSYIENSPNSLGEAMMLGTPCIAANVGGVPDMLIHMEEGILYDPSAYYMLAYHISYLFDNKDLCLKLSNAARKKARATHDVSKNTNQLLGIYQKILE